MHYRIYVCAHTYYQVSYWQGVGQLEVIKVSQHLENFLPLRRTESLCWSCNFCSKSGW